MTRCDIEGLCYIELGGRSYIYLSELDIHLSKLKTLILSLTEVLKSPEILHFNVKYLNCKIHKELKLIHFLEDETLLKDRVNGEIYL